MSHNVGPIIFDLNGLEVTQEEEELLLHPLIGGVILFTRNFSTLKQLAALTQQIREIKKTPLLICVDQEGGRVQRFREEFTEVPAMGTIGTLFHKSQEDAITLANACGFIIAAELLNVGLDLSFAPVLDLHRVNNPIINERAFDADPLVVITLAQAFIQGMQEAGMANCGKHFPGHGSVTVDSHLALPIDERDLSAVSNDDMLPFAEKNLQALMASHILFPQVDDKPVAFSNKWLQHILRDTLGFEGMIFSDCLSMQGAAVIGDCPTRTRQALTAGCDMVLICNSRTDVINTLNQIPKDFKPVSWKRFSSLQGNFLKNRSALHAKQAILKTFTERQSIHLS